MKLPTKYAWLDEVQGLPRMVVVARKEYGLKEGASNINNPVILAWADEIKNISRYASWASDFYNKDSIPWCGLFMAVVAHRANPEQRDDREPPNNYLSALAWAAFGIASPRASIGDVLVFTRSGGGHVGLYIGEDAGAFHVLGGNQSDAVTITRIAKSRMYAVRRPPYKVTPSGAVPMLLTASGVLSKNEA